MCRLAYVHFDASVPQERRVEAVRRLAENSWKLGNTHGVGYVTWDTSRPELLPFVSRSLDIKTFEVGPVGSDALVHARFSTNKVCLGNTHPYAIGGAYLVHNGIVSLCASPNATSWEQKAKTDNDTELILKAYLGSSRDLAKALTELTGMANVGLWDESTQVLSLFPDDKDFHVWSQEGITVVTQESTQNNGVIHPGVGRLYWYTPLEGDRLYQLRLTEATARDDGSFKTELSRAMAEAKEVKRYSPSYTPVLNEWGSTYYRNGTLERYVKDRDGWNTFVQPSRIQTTTDGTQTIEGRVYSAAGYPILSRWPKAEARRYRKWVKNGAKRHRKGRRQAEQKDAARRDPAPQKDYGAWVRDGDIEVLASAMDAWRRSEE